MLTAYLRRVTHEDEVEGWSEGVANGEGVAENKE